MTFTNIKLDAMPADGRQGNIFLLTIRGTLKAKTHEAARPIHNATAGNPAGVAACRSLGDLSHNVFTPAGQLKNEILILDRWTSVAGLNQFFSDPNVQEGGNQIFESRDPIVWAPSPSVPSFHIPSPALSTKRYVGMLRAKVKDVAGASEVWARANREHLNAARLHSQMSNETFVRLTEPGAAPSNEMLGLSVWHDLEGMNAFYMETDFTKFYNDIVVEAPITSVWHAAAGEWTEW